jgi:hypothetical protein
LSESIPVSEDDTCLARDISDVLSSVNEAVSPLGRQSACEAVWTAQDAVPSVHESVSNLQQPAVLRQQSTSSTGGEGTSNCVMSTGLRSRRPSESESSIVPNDTVLMNLDKAVNDRQPLDSRSLEMLKNAVSPDRLQIAVSDDENDIDAALEETSEKIHLTAGNVRSIIHVSFFNLMST